MAVNYRSKKFYNIGPWMQLGLQMKDESKTNFKTFSIFKAD